MYFFYLLIAILLFGILIAAHEFGHFMTAKLLGVKVYEFSVGMGPCLLQKQRGETTYTLRLLPIGGFCALEEENGADPGSFLAAKLWKKLLILVAGSVMNFLAGVLICVALMMQVSVYTAPVLADFMDGFPLEGEQGLMVGDELVEINGYRVYLYQDISMLLGRTEGPVDLLVERDGRRVLLEQLPLEVAEYQYEGTTGRYYGFIFERREASLADRLALGWAQALEFVQMVRLSLVDLVGGKVGLNDVSGVVGIVDTIGSVGAQSQTVGIGLLNVFYFVAFIAVNLAVMNLLPIPALDGGRIFFVLVGALFAKITGKTLDPKYEGYINTAGFILLLGFMALVTLSDIQKLLG